MARERYLELAFTPAEEGYDAVIFRGSHLVDRKLQPEVRRMWQVVFCSLTVIMAPATRSASLLREHVSDDTGNGWTLQSFYPDPDHGRSGCAGDGKNCVKIG